MYRIGQIFWYTLEGRLKRQCHWGGITGMRKYSSTINVKYALSSASAFQKSGFIGGMSKKYQVMLT